MYKDVLRAIAGIDTFPVISLVLFVSAFTLAVLWTLHMDRQSADHLAALPLDPGMAPGGDGQETPHIEGDSRGA